MSAIHDPIERETERRSESGPALRDAPSAPDLQAFFGQALADHDELEQLVGQLFDDLEAWRDRLDAQQQQLLLQQPAAADGRQSQPSLEAGSAPGGESGDAAAALLREALADTQSVLSAAESRLAQEKERRGKLEAEHRANLVELEAMRARAAGLAAQVDDLQRQLEAERDCWTKELNQVRQILERRAAIPGAAAPLNGH